ncbi:hypothetical protein [Ferrimicrobium sp.]|uniref:hypothetical protein n=1 Tax=Ferrimicrobium sp. TaxID=2926050 RepID=UPI00261E8B44|nr:hypothetical protein [Ferrimicrobium sp.]
MARLRRDGEARRGRLPLPGALRGPPEAGRLEVGHALSPPHRGRAGAATRVGARTADLAVGSGALGAGGVVMSVRDAALEQLRDANQRRAVEALAGLQSLPDDHPIWATVALLAAVIGKGNEDTAFLRAEITRLGAEIAEVKGMLRTSPTGSTPELTDIARFMDRVSGAVSGAAHLDAAMPGVLERLEEVLGGIREDIASIEGRLSGREGS